MKLLATLLTAIMISTAASAADKPGLRLGPLELHPRFKIAAMYDSNIYMVPSDLNGVQNGGGVRQASISENLFGLDFKLPLSGMHSFAGGYEISTLFYSTMSKANDMISQSAKLNYAYKGPMGLSAKLGDSFLSTMDPAFSESATRERRWQNTASVAGEYSIGEGPLFIGLSGEQATHKYLTTTMGALLNRYEQTFGGKVGYRLQPKTRAYVVYRRKIIHYSVHSTDQKNNKAHEAGLGIEGRFSPKITGKLEGAMTMRRYDNDGVLKTSETFHRGMSVDAQLNWKPEERWDVSLRAGRSMQESTFQANRFYTSNTLGLTYSHTLPEGMSVRLDVGFTSDRYPLAATVNGKTANRRDDIYQEKLDLDQPLREWLSVFCTYLHRQKFSNFSGQYNYDDHQASAGVKLAL
ncbi:MAG: outer membrane beta-barrel protein [Elusimicrobiota bacterium]|jgi:hypothetical protein